MKPTRLKAIEILLKKTLPDLTQIQGEMEHSGGLTVNIKRF